MRIVAGELKGRRLESPTWSGLRPTSERLRETLFDVLADRVRGVRVLDACAGTGAVGIEALSRGAAEVVFVDDHARAATLVARNLDRCGVAGRGQVLRVPLPRAARHRVLAEPFAIIFVDPPYDDRRIDAILSALAGRLEPGGRLILERADRRSRPEIPGLTAYRTLRVGDSALDFYERTTPPPDDEAP